MIHRWLVLAGTTVVIASGALAVTTGVVAAQAVDRECFVNQRDDTVSCRATLRPTPPQVVSFDTGAPEARRAVMAFGRPNPPLLTIDTQTNHIQTWVTQP